MRKQTEKQWKAAILLSAFLLIACSTNPTQGVSQKPNNAVTPLAISTLDTTAPTDAELEAQVIVTRAAGTLPAECSVRKVAVTLLRFVDAFNRGDQQQLAKVFQSSHYAVDEHGRKESERHFFEIVNQSELLKYFAERHQKGEWMRLLDVSTGSTLGWHGGVDFAYELIRQADDLPGFPSHIAQGKGAMTCPHLQIYLLTMTSAPGVADENASMVPGVFQWSLIHAGCPAPPSDSPPHVVIACTREQP